MKDTSKMVIIVSGGGRGLGQAIVSTLLDSGHIVATFGRRKTTFIEALQDSAASSRFLWRQMDITDSTAVPLFVREVFKMGGRIDGLINNAAIAVDGILTMQSADEIHKMLAVNLEATIFLTRICAKHMLAQGDGCVINISSVVGLRGSAGVSVYGATKGGLDAFTRGLARELGSRNIRVNSIAPGYLETDMTNELTPSQRQQIIRRTPLGRLGQAEDVCGLVEFLLSKKGSFITGQTLVVDGGLTC